MFKRDGNGNGNGKGKGSSHSVNGTTNGTSNGTSHNGNANNSEHNSAVSIKSSLPYSVVNRPTTGLANSSKIGPSLLDGRSSSKPLRAYTLPVNVTRAAEVAGLVSTYVVLAQQIMMDEPKIRKQSAQPLKKDGARFQELEPNNYMHQTLGSKKTVLSAHYNDLKGIIEAANAITDKLIEIRKGLNSAADPDLIAKIEAVLSSDPNKISELTQSAEQLKLKNEVLQRNNNILSSRMQQLEQQIKKQNKEFEETVGENASRIKVLEKNQRNTEEKIAQHKQQLEVFQQDQEKNKKLISEKDRALQLLRQNIIEIQKDRDEIREQLRGASSASGASSSENNVLKKKLAEANKNLTEAIEKNKKIQSEIEKISQKNAGDESRINEAEKNIEKLKLQISKKDEKIKELEDSSINAAIKYESNISALKKELFLEKNKSKKLVKKNKQLKANKINSNRKISQLENTILSERGSALARQKRVETQNKILTKVLTHAQKNVAAYQERFLANSKKLTTLERERDEALNLSVSNENDMNAALKQANNLHANNQQLQDQLQQLQAQNTANTDALAKLRVLIGTLTGHLSGFALDQTSAQRQSLLAEVQKVKGEMEVLMGVLKLAPTQINFLPDSISQLEVALKQQQPRLEQIQQPHSANQQDTKEFVLHQLQNIIITSKSKENGSLFSSQLNNSPAPTNRQNTNN